MRKNIFLTTLLLFLCTAIMAQSTAVGAACKSVFTLTTFKADGSILSSSHGVFIGSDGTAISPWQPFAGAHHAVVIDSNGKRMDVDCMIGANELYDVAKFRVKGTRITSSAIATTDAKEGSKVWLASYSVGKSNLRQMKISKVEKFMDKYSYYILNGTIDETSAGCPLIDNNGNVLGLVQRSDNDTHATSARFIGDMKASGLTASDPVLRQTGIRPALPDTQNDALLSMILSAQTGDSAKHVATVEEFISKFPSAPDGYIYRAQYEVQADAFASAAQDMETAIAKAEKKDDAHFTYAKLIYNKELLKGNIPYEPWTLDRAIEEADKAYAINPQPIYKHLKAQIAYTKGEYQSAYDQFMELTKTPLRNSELYFEAAQCKRRMQASDADILQLLDSAVVVSGQTPTVSAAAYFLARATQLDNMGEYRKALADYNKYDTLCLGRVSADFLYAREQCEVKCRLFKQALDDITLATRLAPQEPLYLAEKANLQLRVGQYYEAIATATSCIDLAPDFASAHLVLGLAQIQTGQKTQGLQSLQKAKDLGDEQAQNFIDRFK